MLHKQKARAHTSNKRREMDPFADEETDMPELFFLFWINVSSPQSNSNMFTKNYRFQIIYCGSKIDQMHITNEIGSAYFARDGACVFRSNAHSDCFLYLSTCTYGNESINQTNSTRMILTHLFYTTDSTNVNMELLFSSQNRPNTKYFKTP